MKKSDTRSCDRFRAKALALVLATAGISLAHAQQPPADPTAPPPPVAAPAASAADPADATVTPTYIAPPSKPWLLDPETLPSLFFSTWTQALIAEARFSFQTRPPTEAEIRAAQDAADRGEQKDPGLREISLGGIVFADAGDWTIWLNGQRVLPEALPPEILDLKVHRHFIEIKWFDAYTNQVFPVRLRPHQRFNLDTRIFLPG